MTSELYLMPPIITPLRVNSFISDGFPLYGFEAVSRNHDKIIKPIESVGYSAHFAFSYGHIVKNAGYETQRDYVFHFEEPY